MKLAKHHILELGLVSLSIFPIHHAMSQSAFKPDAAFEQKELQSLKTATPYQDNNGALPPRNPQDRLGCNSNVPEYPGDQYSVC
jgi:hypothetical protein